MSSAKCTYGLLWIILFSISLYGTTSAQSDDQLITEEHSLAVNFKKYKDDKFFGKGDIDNRWEIFEPQISIECPFRIKNSKGNTCFLIILGESSLNDEMLKVFFREEIPFHFKESANFEWHGKKIKIEYDPYSPPESQSYQYEGYIIIIKNSKGDVVFTKSSRSKWIKDLEVTLDLKQGKTYTEDQVSGKSK